MTPKSSLLGYRDEIPFVSGVMHTDGISGLMGFGALLIALHHSQSTGLGPFIDLSQQETGITFIGEQLTDYTMTGQIPSRMGKSRSTNGTPRQLPLPRR